MANEVGTVGLEKNIDQMKQMYIMSPTTEVINGIQFGSGDWTAV